MVPAPQLPGEKGRGRNDPEHVDDIGERLRQDRLLCGKRIGKSRRAVRTVTPILGKSSRSGSQAQQLPRFTQILRAGRASDAVSTTDQRIGYDSSAIATSANQFMAKNSGGRRRVLWPEKARNVGTTDASDLDGNFLFSAEGLRAGTLFQFNFAGSGIDQGAH